MLARVLLLPFLILFSLPCGFGQRLQEEITCDYNWQVAPLGACMGSNNSLLPYDLDQDGIPELITYTNRPGNYWYILKYNPVREDYESIHISHLFYQQIEQAALLDLIGNGVPQLVIMADNNVHVIDLSDFSTIINTTIPQIEQNNDFFVLRLGDGDNDGDQELMIAGTNVLVLLNPATLEEELVLNLPAGNFVIEQLDDDVEWEIAFAHGRTIQVDATGEITDEYDFRPGVDFSTSMIESTDIDNDGKHEVILANINISVRVFNVEQESIAWEQYVGSFVTSLSVLNVDIEESKEILYATNNSTFCRKGSTGSLLWTLNENTGGATQAITLGDFDGDQELELLLATGCGATGSSHLLIYQASDQSLEWKSVHENSPYLAIQSADIDNDGEMEIIVVSRHSEYDLSSTAGKAGIITIYDGTTRAIEFRSDPEFLPFSNLGFFNVNVFDYQNDGDLDIIIASGGNGNGAIWIIDGASYTIEAERIYSIANDGIEYLTALTIADLDNDGEVELIACSSLNMFIINSTTLEPEWESANFMTNIRTTKIITGNTDTDAHLEVAACQDYIYFYNDGVVTQSPDDDYQSIVFFDWDGDGSMELLAGDSQGDIDVFHPNTFELITAISVGDNGGDVTALAVADLNDDGNSELLAAIDGAFYFVSLNEPYDYVRTQQMAGNLGDYDALLVEDVDQDGQLDIIMGSDLRIFEIDPNCAQCLFFDATLEAQNTRCGENNGLLIASSPDPGATFTWQDVSFTDTLPDLSAMLYRVTATNASGCSRPLEARVLTDVFFTNIYTEPRSCEPTPDGYALTYVVGAEPISYLWSTGDTLNAIETLDVGTYSVFVTDANGCQDTLTAIIEQKVLDIEAEVLAPSCPGLNSGRARLQLIEGTFPYAISWNNSTPAPLLVDTLPPGENTLYAINNDACRDSFLFVIPQNTLAIHAQPLNFDCNDTGSGAAFVTGSEGDPPYAYLWSDPSNTTSDTLINVSEGEYYVTLTDDSNCSLIDTVVVAGTVLEILYQQVDVSCFGDSNGSAAVFVTEGTPPYQYNWTNGATSSTINNLSAGSYGATIEDSRGCQINIVFPIISPSVLEINASIVNDDATTSTAEGSIIATVTGGTPPYQYLWNNGAMTDTLENLMTGDYQLVVMDQNSCQIDSNFVIDLINEVLSPIRINTAIFPNPTRTRLQLSFTEAFHLQQLQLFDASGRLIKPNLSFNGISDQQFSVTLPDLPSGSYWLSILTDQGITQQQLIIQ